MRLRASAGRALLLGALLLPLPPGEGRGEGKASANKASSPNLATAKIIDLSHPFDEETIYWPTSPSSFKLEKLAYGDTPSGFFYSSFAFCTPEHGGTHLDAPIHFSKTGHTVDQIPVRQLVAPAVVIDISKQTEANADYRLTAEDVRAFEKAHGPISAGTIVLLRTGWGKRWP